MLLDINLTSDKRFSFGWHRPGEIEWEYKSNDEEGGLEVLSLAVQGTFFYASVAL